MNALRAATRPAVLLLIALLSLPSAFAAGSGVVGENLLWLAIILMAARLFAPLAQRVGFPAVLGELLRAKSPKFALLETLVAARLQPNDWLARRDLVAGLLDARLDDRAAAELAVLRRIHPRWADDPVAAVLERTLAERRAGALPGRKP